MFNESMFRMLLELQVSSVGRAVLFDVARDLTNLRTSASGAAAAEVALANASAARIKAQQAGVAALRDYDRELEVAAGLAEARAAVAVESEARILASTTATAAAQDLATARRVAAQAAEQAANEAYANSYLAQNAAVIAAAQAEARQAEATAAAEELRANAVRGAGSAMVLAGAGLVATSAVIGGVMGETAAQAANFNMQILHVQNNTGIARSSIDGLKTAILGLGESTGLAFEDLSNAFRLAYDLSQNAAAATAELTVASHNAVATGADVKDVTSALAQAMHVYSLDVSNAATETQRQAEIQQNAANTMQILQTGANESRLTLEQYAKSFAIVGSWAAATGVSIDQASAAFAALSKDTGNSARAGTQVIDMFQHIINPSSQARQEIERVSRLTGVNLKDDFTSAGLASRNLTGILADMNEAFRRMGLSEQEAAGETLRMIPNLRGGVGAFMLLGNAASDYAKIIDDTSNKQANIQRDQAAYQEALAATATQWQILQRNVQGAAIELGADFLPVANSTISNLIGVAKSVGDFASANRDLLSTVVPLVVEVTALGGVALTLAGLATVVTLLSPVGLAIGGITLALGALAVAYSRDIGGIRQVTDTAVPVIKRDYDIWAEAIQVVIDKEQQLQRQAASTASKVPVVGGVQAPSIGGVLSTAGNAIGVLGPITAAFNLFQTITNAVNQQLIQLDSTTRTWGSTTRDAERADEEASIILQRHADIMLVAGDHMRNLNLAIDAEAAAAAAAGGPTMSLEAAIASLGASANEVISELGGLNAMIEQFVSEDAGLQAAQAASDGAAVSLEAYKDAQLKANAATGGTNAAMRALENQSRLLTAQIDKAKQALQDLAHPDLIDIHPFNQQLSDMAKQIQQLQLQRSTLLAGGASPGGAEVQGLNAQIQQLQRASMMVQDQRSFKLSGEMRQINEGIADATRKPGNGPITFEAAMAQIAQIKRDLPGWEIQEANIKDQIAQMRANMSDVSSRTKDAKVEQDKLTDAAKNTLEVYNAMKASLIDISTWLQVNSAKMHGQGPGADAIASLVDTAAKALFGQIEADRKLPPDLAAAAIKRDKAAFDAYVASLSAMAQGLPTGNALPSSGASRVGSVTGFASGGSFTVPGAGGVDSSLVSFFATPGESVSVGWGGRGGGGRTINFNMSVGTIQHPSDEKRVKSMIEDALMDLLDAGDRPQASVNPRLPGAR